MGFFGGGGGCFVCFGLFFFTTIKQISPACYTEFNVMLIKANNSIQRELNVQYKENSIWKEMVRYRQSSLTLNIDLYLVFSRITHKLCH